MTNAISHIGHPTSLHHGAHAITAASDASAVERTSTLTDQLKQQIEQVNTIERDAQKAIDDIAAARRSDLHSVMLAKEKTDAAYTMLLDVRRAVTNAYERLNQARGV